MIRLESSFNISIIDIYASIYLRERIRDMAWIFRRLAASFAADAHSSIVAARQAEFSGFFLWMYQHFSTTARRLTDIEAEEISQYDVGYTPASFKARFAGLRPRCRRRAARRWYVRLLLAGYAATTRRHFDGG